MKIQVFTYGTLIYPEVMHAVTGCQFDSVAALLPGYARYKVRGHVFPGIVEDTGQSVNGLLYSGIDVATLQRLDDFESDIYNRRQVRVTLENQEQLSVWTYVVSSSHRKLLTDEDWDPVVFRDKHLSAYLKRAG